MRNYLLKGFTITLFVALITSFVLYRIGYMDNDTFSSPNTGNLSNSNTTVAPTKDSLIPDEFISSSKSISLPKSKKTNPNALLKNRKNDSIERQQKMFMLGSKSAAIFTPSLKLDTARIKLKTEK